MPLNIDQLIAQINAASEAAKAQIAAADQQFRAAVDAAETAKKAAIQLINTESNIAVLADVALQAAEIILSPFSVLAILAASTAVEIGIQLLQNTRINAEMAKAKEAEDKAKLAHDNTVNSIIDNLKATIEALLFSLDP